MAWYLVKPKDNFTFTLPLIKSQDTSVSIVTGYGLDNQMIGVQFPAGAVNFSL
jgi:hypothetical protein